MHVGFVVEMFGDQKPARFPFFLVFLHILIFAFFHARLLGSQLMDQERVVASDGVNLYPVLSDQERLLV